MVAVTNVYDELMSMLGEGASFGELAMLATSRRTANCVCITHCDLCVLSGGALNQVMKVGHSLRILCIGKTVFNMFLNWSKMQFLADSKPFQHLFLMSYRGFIIKILFTCTTNALVTIRGQVLPYVYVQA